MKNNQSTIAAAQTEHSPDGSTIITRQALLDGARRRHQEIHAKLAKTLASPAAQSLAALIRAGLADMDAGRETAEAQRIRAITHQVYFDRTNFANSSGREYFWIFVLAEAARTARDNAPEKICKYLSEEEAIHWLRQAQASVDRLIEAVEKLNNPS